MDTTKCVGAILLILTSTAVTAAQLLKLRKFVSAAGGIQQAAHLLVNVASGAEQLEEFGPVAAAFGGEILGIATIYEACR